MHCFPPRADPANFKRFAKLPITAPPPEELQRTKQSLPADVERISNQHWLHCLDIGGGGGAAVKHVSFARLLITAEIRFI